MTIQMMLNRLAAECGKAADDRVNEWTTYAIGAALAVVVFVAIIATTALWVVPMLREAFSRDGGA